MSIGLGIGLGIDVLGYGGAGVARITFTDSFTGADGAAPNARWTLVNAGWTIQSNALSYVGGTYGDITAACTAGDNTFSAISKTVTNAYPALYIRYIDANNWVGVVSRTDNAEKLRLTENVAGVQTTIADEAVASWVSGVARTILIQNVGNNITVKVNGSTVITGSSTQHTTATKVGFGMNSGQAVTVIFDDAVLA